MIPYLDITLSIYPFTLDITLSIFPFTPTCLCVIKDLRFERQLSRMDCHTGPTGFGARHFSSRAMRVTFKQQHDMHVWHHRYGFGEVQAHHRGVAAGHD